MPKYRRGKSNISRNFLILLLIALISVVLLLLWKSGFFDFAIDWWNTIG